MQDLNAYILESQSDYKNPIEGIDWDNPNKEGCQVLEKWLKENNLMPKGKIYSNKYLKYQIWNVYVVNDTYCLGYEYEMQRPFKKNVHSKDRILEFYKEHLLAVSKGGNILYPEESKADYKVINPIAEKLGMKYNKTGEFKPDGVKSCWDD